MTDQPSTCPVPLGGRGGQPCGQPALHVVHDWRRRSNADQRYSVCCDHAPGRRHSLSDHDTCDECGCAEHAVTCSHHWTQTVGAP